VIHFTSPAGWLPVHRDQLRAQRSVTSMGKLYLLIRMRRLPSAGACGHQQNPPVLNWRCRLTQVDLYNGCKMGGWVWLGVVYLYCYLYLCCPSYGPPYIMFLTCPFICAYILAWRYSPISLPLTSNRYWAVARGMEMAQVTVLERALASFLIVCCEKYHFSNLHT